MSRYIFAAIYFGFCLFLCLAVGEVSYSIIIFIAMYGLFIVLDKVFFGALEIKRIIHESKFSFLLKYKHPDYMSCLKDKYIDAYCSENVNRDEEEIYFANLTLEERINKLEELYNRLIGFKGFRTNVTIINAIETLLFCGKNKLKHKDIFENGILFEKVYYSKTNNMEIEFKSILYGDSRNKSYLIYSYKENIYFIDDDTYDLVDEWTIFHKDLDYIERGMMEIDAFEYVPHYKRVVEPVNWARNAINLEQKKYFEDKYQKELAEYQAELLKAEAHNRMEEEKYRNSLKKTYKVLFMYFYRKNKLSNGQHGFIIIGSNGLLPEDLSDIEIIRSK